MTVLDVVAADARTRNWWPSMCVPCGISGVWFPTQVDRLHWELQHEHGGTD